MDNLNTSRRRFLQLALAAGASAPGLVFPQGAVAEAGRMRSGRPSATAEGAAMLRAAHQLLDAPRIFDDPLALRIIGPENEARLWQRLDYYRARRSLRAYVALRSRYAEDAVADAVERGIHQYVVLGAGLDSFAYRSPYAPSDLRVFEVDHPATQSWKRARLRESGIAVPESLTYAPVDFERETLGAGLARAGFDADEPACFSMLGVVVYLTKPAVLETLRWVAARPQRSEIVFSYSVPMAMLPVAQRGSRAAAALQVAAAGEPWITYFDPPTLAAELTALGFSEIEDLGPDAANARYFGGRGDGLRVTGSSRLMWASV